jgi:hypothetical protein
MRKPRDKNESSGQIVPLEKARAVAKPKPVTQRAFKRFVEACDELCEYCTEFGAVFQGLSHALTIAGLEGDAEYCQELMARCEAGLVRFDRPENYVADEDGEPMLSPVYISKRLGIMLASYPNANLSDPEGYVRMTTERLGVTNVSEVSLESALCEAVDKHKFPPATAELLPIIEQHIERWRARRWTIQIQEADRTRLRAIESLIERKRIQDENNRERELQQAINAVRGAMRVTRELAQKIGAKQMDIEKTKQELAALVQKHSEAERRESELLRKLNKLEASEDGRTADAAGELDSHGCAELDLSNHGALRRRASAARPSARAGGR